MADGIASGVRPRTASRPAQLEMSAARANRVYGGGEAQAQRLQAQTIALHEDVLHAQARLRIVSRSVTVNLSDPSPWVRRALGRINVDATAPPTPNPPGVRVIRAG